MRIVLIDDEPLSLKDTLQAVKKACPNDEVIPFDDPYELLDYCLSNPVEIAFLDINMPKMTGTDLAKELKEESPKMNIIFTTAYDDYYRQAMELRASGYLLKPVLVKDIKAELSNLRYETGNTDEKLAHITCFGTFVVKDAAGKEVVFERKASREVLAYLVHRSGNACNSREIAAAIFEDDPYDAKRQAYLQKIISSMMKSLRNAGLEEIIDKKYNSMAINVDVVDCDYYRYRDLNMDVLDYRSDEYLEEFEWARDLY